jgi:hypothetical protein
LSTFGNKYPQNGSKNDHNPRRSLCGSSSLSHRKGSWSRFAKVNSPTNPSTYPNIKNKLTDLRGS